MKIGEGHEEEKEECATERERIRQTNVVEWLTI